MKKIIMGKIIKILWCYCAHIKMENFMFILCYEHIAYIKNNFDAVIKRRERLENYSIFFP